MRCSQRAPPQPSAHTGASCTTRASRGAGLGRASAAASRRTTPPPFAVLIEQPSGSPRPGAPSTSAARRASDEVIGRRRRRATTSSHARRSFAVARRGAGAPRLGGRCRPWRERQPVARGADEDPPSHAQRPCRRGACLSRGARGRSLTRAARFNSHAQVALRQRPWSEQSHVVPLWKASVEGKPTRRRNTHVRLSNLEAAWKLSSSEREASVLTPSLYTNSQEQTSARAKISCPFLDACARRILRYRRAGRDSAKTRPLEVPRWILARLSCV